MQFRKIIPNAIHKHPSGTSSSHEEAMPPPIIVLAAELDIYRDDSNLSDSNYQNDRYDGEEAKDVVIPALILPQGLEDEEELDEYYSEGD
jgi:hypothetical protein